MAETIGGRIKAAREALRMSQATLAKAMKVDQSTIALWETDRTSPRPTKMDELARVLYLTPEFLMFGAREVSETTSLDVPLVGYLGANGIITRVDKKGARRFPIPPNEGREHPPAVGAVIIDSNNHWPLYRHGDTLFYADRRAPKDLIGLEAVVELTNGDLVIGTVATCRRKNICSLAFVNAPIRQDEEVNWAGPVVWVRRSLVGNVA